MKEQKSLPFSASLSIFFRSFLIQSVWNYQSLLSVGFAFCLIPIARRLYKDQAERIGFLRRHLGFFNAHPYFASYALGAISRVEGDRQTGPEMIDRFRNALIGPLGAIGDQLFWGTIKPGCILFAMIGVLLIDRVHLLVAYFIAVLICYNIPHLLIRAKGILVGYREGFNVYKLLNIVQFQNFRIVYRGLGAISLGFVIGFNVLEYGRINPTMSAVFGLSICGSYIFHKWKHSFYRNALIILTGSVLIGIILENL
jgi:mannose/fructose/N-acetylgalactosamine-specific phosphotransferase system component IID